MMSLLVFFFAAMVITAQVFFFSNVSSESVKEDRDIQSVRMQLEGLVNYAENLIAQNKIDVGNKQDKHKIIFSEDIKANYKNFYENTIGTMPKDFTDQNYNYSAGRDNFTLNVHKLDYEYQDKTFNDSDWPVSMDYRIFPPMKDHFLIRVGKRMPAENHFMIQVLVQSTDITFITKTHEEIWY